MGDTSYKSFSCNKSLGITFTRGVSTFLAMAANRKNPTVFYGWWVVSASFLISLYTGGTIALGFTAVFEPIAQEFGWSYAHVSLAASLIGLETSLLAPLLGFLVDRWGARRWLFVGVIIIGFGLIVLSRIRSLTMFYGAFFLIALGMGVCSSTLFLTAVANWFRRNVSMATGITASGFALGGLIVPVVAALIDKFGWRTTMASLGLATWAICLPLSLVFRHKPEQYGWLPDGDAISEKLGAATAEGLTSTNNLDVDITGKKALGSRIFWHISLAFMCQMLVVNAVVVHVMPYLGRIDVPRSVSSLVASAVPVVSICGRLGFGWLGDRLRWHRCSG